jgi:thioredoxin reductase
MAFDMLKIILHGITWFIPYIVRTGLLSLYAIYHFYTYTATESPKHIVVIGGSFAGLQLVRRLTQTVPNGYKIIWIEKNSHLNYVFAFPRFSVLPGLEERAFIPYSAVEAGAPKGSVRRVQGTVSWVNREAQKVVLDGGEEIPFEYLAIATGSTQPLPVRVQSTERNDACDELRAVQAHIKASQKIAILGGGAVGVELASDIKDFYPGKDVTLVHSRDVLLNRFGPRLQEYALRALRDELGIRVLLGERPVCPTAYGKGSLARDARLVFRDGQVEEFDLVVCALLIFLLPIPFHGQGVFASANKLPTDRVYRPAPKLTHSRNVIPGVDLRKDVTYSCLADPTDAYFRRPHKRDYDPNRNPQPQTLRPDIRPRRRSRTHGAPNGPRGIHAG